MKKHLLSALGYLACVLALAAAAVLVAAAVLILILLLQRAWEEDA